MNNRDDDPNLITDQTPDKEWRIISSYVDDCRIPGLSKELSLYRKGYQFLRRMKHRPSPSEHLQIQKKYPIMYKAYALYKDLTSCRWIIEAGILADVDVREIGEYVGVEPDVIALYEKLFFNIRDMRTNRGYIQNLINLPAHGKWMDSRDYDFMYKVLAFYGGWNILKEFIESKTLSPETDKWIVRSCLDKLKKVGWTALHRVEPNQYNAMEIVQQLLELRKDEKEGEEGRTRYDNQAEDMMRSLLGTGFLSIMPRMELQANEVRASRDVKPYKGLFTGETGNGNREIEQR